MELLDFISVIVLVLRFIRELFTGQSHFITHPLSQLVAYLWLVWLTEICSQLVVRSAI